MKKHKLTLALLVLILWWAVNSYAQSPQIPIVIAVDGLAFREIGLGPLLEPLKLFMDSLPKGYLGDSIQKIAERQGGGQ